MKLESIPAADVQFDPDETATPRIAAPPPRSPGPLDPPPESRPAPYNDGPSKAYIGGGVGIKTSYSTKDVLDITSTALKRPLTSFLQTLGDFASKLVDGKPLPSSARESIKRYTDPVDSTAAMTGVGGALQLVGTGIEAANKSIYGEPGTSGETMENLNQIVGTVPTRAVSTSTRSGQARPYSVTNQDMPGPAEFAVQPEACVPQQAANPDPDTVVGSPGRRDATAQQRASRIFRQLAGSGPINLEPAADATDDDARLKAFGHNFSFYRDDSDVNDMADPADVHAAASNGRRGVLTLGKGAQATSFAAELKGYLGRAWVPGGGPSGLEGTDIVKLGSGKDGVAAIKLRFEDLAPGSTTIVTGGPMQGSTMLFAADQQGFYAYHAGASNLRPQWDVAEDGARSIVDAHRQMHGTALAASSAGVTNHRNDLMAAAKEYPFSALIYDGDYSSETGRKTPDHRIDAPVHMQGTDAAGQPHGMLTFSYFEPNPDLRTVGTAQAVISKDLNGKVVVSVLGERGKLDQMKTLSLHGGSVGFRYSTIGGATMSYPVPG